MKQWLRIAILALMACTLSLATACAEKQTVEMGTSMTSLTRLPENYAEGVEFFFDYDNLDLPMAVVFKTQEQPMWYTIRVTNHSMNNTGFSVFYGLLTRVFPFDSSKPTATQPELFNYYLCTKQGKAQTLIFNLKLDPGKEYLLNFNAVSVTSGTVSFVIEPKLDLEGDSMSEAQQLTIAEFIEKTMATAEDIDYFKIPAYDHDENVSLVIRNRINDSKMIASVYNSFKEKILECDCPYGEVIRLPITLEENIEYYVEIHQEGTDRMDGRYEIGYCDDQSHLLGERLTINDATCQVAGLSGRMCFFCENWFEEESISAAHVPGEMHTVKDATCQEEGVRKQFCMVCDIVLNEESIPPISHTAGEWKVETVPTCTEAGLNAQRCTFCNEIVNSQEIAATGHEEGEPVVTQEATCLQKGTKTTQCTKCQEVLSTEELPMTGHTLGTMNVLAPATCLTEGSAEQRCTVCNALISQETLPALGHVPGGWTQTRAATCTADGLRQQYCQTCNQTLNTETVKSFGHSAGEWQITTSATCLETGLKEKFCTVCGVSVEKETLAALGHTAGEMETTREAECLQSGLREKRCLTCGTVLESETLEALGHSYTAWEITAEATKEREGDQIRHCIRCGDTQTEKIPKIEKFMGIF